MRKDQREEEEERQGKEMETVKNLLRPKPNPQQQLREWQRRLRQECRNIERQIRGTYIPLVLLIN